MVLDHRRSANHLQFGLFGQRRADSALKHGALSGSDSTVRIIFTGLRFAHGIVGSLPLVFALGAYPEAVLAQQSEKPVFLQAAAVEQNSKDALKQDAVQKTSADTKRKPAEQAALFDRLSTSVEQVNTERARLKQRLAEIGHSGLESGHCARRAKPAFGNWLTNDPIALNVDALSVCGMAIIIYTKIPI